MPAFMGYRAGYTETGWREKEKNNRLKREPSDSVEPQGLQRALSKN
jgi:hypothetical protein